MTLGSKQQRSETGKKYQMNDFLLQAGCESPSAGLVNGLGDLLLETGIPGIALGHTRCRPF